METLILKNIVTDTGSNQQGEQLFSFLKDAYLNNKPLILEVDSDLTLSSSFLNSSIGLFLEQFGLVNFKKTIQFKGNKNQFDRLVSYINKYKEVYSIN
jgi:hypothetical protein